MSAAPIQTKAEETTMRTLSLDEVSAVSGGAEGDIYVCVEKKNGVLVCKKVS